MDIVWLIIQLPFFYTEALTDDTKGFKIQTIIIDVKWIWRIVADSDPILRHAKNSNPESQRCMRSYVLIPQ
jgi:hypothetical protein